MYKEKKILAVILARGGSKRLPGKNVRELGGVPLIGYSIKAAAESELVDEVIVSSDSDEILAVSSKFSCITQKRPSELAQDETTSVETLKYVVDNVEEDYDLIVLLQATSPFRGTEMIDECIKVLVDNDLDSTQTVNEVDEKPEIMFVEVGNSLVFSNKEAFFDKSLRKKHYILNGAVYVVRKEVFVSSGGLYGDKNKPVVMDKKDSLDIDTYEDWYKAVRRLEESNESQTEF